MSIARSLRVAAVPFTATARVTRLRRRPRLDGETRLDLVSHLDELRRRLTICAIAILGGFAVAFAVHAQIIEALTQPLGDAKPVTLGVAEPFMTAVRVSFMTALAITLPILLFQTWSFISPACKAGTRRTVAGFVAAGSVVFIGGVLFAYFFALPGAIGFLTQFDANLYDVQVRAQEYLTFAAAVLLSVGLVFQLPIALLALVRFRVLSHGNLKRNRKIAYVSLAALAVLMPGVDPVTTTMWLVPLFFLYEGTVLVAGRYERRLEKAGLATETLLERRFRAKHASDDEDIDFSGSQHADDGAEILQFRRRLGLD